MIWGQDGTGKTTFLQKISSDWSKTVKGSKESNPSIAQLNHKLWNVGLLIPFVLSEVRGGTSLEEVIKKQLGLQQNSQIKTVRDFLQHHPEHSLLVMDGLDECNLDEKSDIFKILSGEMLSEVLCIVTSNPDFKQKISFDCEIQLLGFTERKAKDYIFQFFRPGERRDGLPQRVRSSKGENMWDKIKFNEDLLQMAFYPPLLELMCCLYRDTGKLGKYPAEVLDEIMDYILYQNYRKYNRDSADISAIKKMQHKNLMTLGAFALGRLKRDQSEVTFETSKIIGILGSGIMELGFLKNVPRISEFHPARVTFIHWMMQEYLAAWYVANLAPSDGESQLLEFCSSPDISLSSPMVIQILMALSPYLKQYVQNKLGEILHTWEKQKKNNILSRCHVIFSLLKESDAPTFELPLHVSLDLRTCRSPSIYSVPDNQALIHLYGRPSPVKNFFDNPSHQVKKLSLIVSSWTMLHHVMMKDASNLITLEMDLANQVTMEGDVGNFEAFLKRYPTLMYIFIYNCSEHIKNIAEVVTRIYPVTSLELICKEMDTVLQYNMKTETIILEASEKDILQTMQTPGQLSKVTKIDIEGYKYHAADMFNSLLNFKNFHSLKLGSNVAGISHDAVKRLRQSLSPKRDLQKMILGEGQCKIGNDMEILLSSLADNTKLEILVFSRNLLGFEGYKSLANAAKDLRNMKELRIAGCGGTNSKEFETLFSSISSEQMEVLDVSSNKLGDAGVQALGHFVERQHSLKELRADSCQTASTDSWEPLLQGLQQTDKLQILSVENNLIGEKMKILMISMFSLDHLKHLNIGNCGCEQPVILSNILSKLVSNDEVEFVNFGGNTLDITCVQQVEAAPNLGRLQTMCVAKSFQNDPESINCITESMKKAPSLTKLDLSNHQINGTLLADSLECWPKLKCLSLAECGLSEEEIVANVLRKLSFNKLIEILNLSWNNLGNKGFMELDSTLENMNNLTELNVCQCEGSNIDIMGAFLQSLKTKNKLRKLDLSHNYVGSKGVEILSDHAPKSIEHLRMRFCQVKGAKEVIKLLINLAGNGNLKVLDLCNNKIGNGIMNLVGLRKCLEKMQVLDLSENELDVEQSLKLEKDVTSRYPQMEFLV